MNRGAAAPAVPPRPLSSTRVESARPMHLKAAFGSFRTGVAVPAAILLLGCCLASLAACGGGENGRGAGDRHRREQFLAGCCLRDMQPEAGAPVRVCPPGTCPGHFDIRPGAVAELRDCRLLFLFDFQRSLGEKLGGLEPGRLKTVAIGAPEGMCIPAGYLAGCRAVHDALGAADPARRPQLAGALEAVRTRMAALETALHGQVREAGLDGAKVIASGHQAAFCRWLGLDPVATDSAAETAAPAPIEDLLARGKAARVRLVVANLQEGTGSGEALAGRLGVPVVVFSNFPSMNPGDATFDEMVRSNVANLIRIGAKPQ